MNKLQNILNLLSKPLLFAFLLLAIMPLSVKAHPHNWITVKSEFLIDEKGQLTTVREYWEFDIYFSMMTIADVMHESTVQPNSLQLLADDMINNMESYQYFSSLKISNQTVPLGRPDKYELIINTIEGQQQLVLFMDFQLAKPLPLNNQPLLWQVYDPTYYIDMRHHDTSQIIITNKRGNECTTTIDLAEPTQEMAEYAMSLDRSQTETQGLGKSFAEKIIIKCLEPTLNISM
ncbi:DUF1007 family protein [Psychromonas sp.]|nr:DUF1007 family protein [Psychromonas sp.]